MPKFRVVGYEIIFLTLSTANRILVNETDRQDLLHRTFKIKMSAILGLHRQARLTEIHSLRIHKILLADYRVDQLRVFTR